MARIKVATPVYKHPAESKRLFFDFARLLGDGATLSSDPAVTATPSGHVTETAALATSSVSISGTRVNFTCAGGTAGEEYCVDGQVTDSDGQIHVIEGTLRVRQSCTPAI